SARTGGWGYVLGDEGSGYALAVEGLRAAVRSADGRGPRTVLLERLLAALKLSTPSEFIPAIYQPPMSRTSMASLAPVVLQSALEGDQVAGQIVKTAADELALMVGALARKLNIDRQPF